MCSHSRGFYPNYELGENALTIINLAMILSSAYDEVGFGSYTSVSTIYSQATLSRRLNHNDKKNHF